MVVQVSSPASQVVSDGQSYSDYCLNLWEFPSISLRVLWGFGSLDWKTVPAREQVPGKPIICIKKKQDEILKVQVDPDCIIVHEEEAARPVGDRKAQYDQNDKRVKSPTPATPLDTKINTPRSMRLNWHHLIAGVALMFLECMGHCQVGGSALIRTDQPLPPECLEQIRIWDCPLKDTSDSTAESEWGKLNNQCCSGFPNTSLHCQRGHLVPGQSEYGHNFPACLQEEIVLAGNALRLDNSTGSPRLVHEPCESSMYEDKDRISSDISFPYCTKRQSNCNAEGEEYLYRGNTSHKAICTCRSGYKRESDGCLAESDDTTPTPPFMDSSTTPAGIDSPRWNRLPTSFFAVMDASKTPGIFIGLPVVAVILLVIGSVICCLKPWICREN